MPNVTVTVGRDALLACVVEDLRGYKVRYVLNYENKFSTPTIFRNMLHEIGIYVRSFLQYKIYDVHSVFQIFYMYRTYVPTNTQSITI